jgi:hypothetical protein
MGCRQGDRIPERLLGNGVHESQQRLGLVSRTSQLDERTDGLCVLEGFLDLLQFLHRGALWCVLVGRRERLHTLAARDGKDVELVVDDKA